MNTRATAAQILTAVIRDQHSLNDLLQQKIPLTLADRDRGLIKAYCFGVLRWYFRLKIIADLLVYKPIKSREQDIACLLLIGLYQLIYLNTPPHAAVSETVNAAQILKKPWAKGLLNQALHQFIQRREFFLQTADAAETGKFSHPQWMIERWIAHFGEAMTIALLQANNAAPLLSCAIQRPEQRSEILRELKTAGMRVEDGVFLKTAIAVSGGSPARTDAFRTGKISIQDEASQAIPLLLDVHPGDRVLDLCAAPGGKTLQMVRAAASKGFIVATDLHSHRVDAMQAQFNRLKLSNIRIMQLDATRPLPFATTFNRILVDAPCSGTGTLARHPEIRWRLQPRQFEQFHPLQIAILCNAAAHLAPGGRLVYSTCSLEGEENEQVVSEALARISGVHLAAKSEVGRALQEHLASDVQLSDLLDAAGEFRTIPGKQHTDGFFAAVLVRERE